MVKIRRVGGREARFPWTFQRRGDPASDRFGECLPVLLTQPEARESFTARVLPYGASRTRARFAVPISSTKYPGKIITIRNVLRYQPLRATRDFLTRIGGRPVYDRGFARMTASFVAVFGRRFDSINHGDNA